MLEYIINNFRNNSQFINDFDGLEIYLDGLDISFEEKINILKEVFEYNNKIYSIICVDNKRLAKIISTRQTTRTIKPIPMLAEVKELETKKSTPLNVDVNFYMHGIKTCTDLSEIERILPDKKQDNYAPVIYTVLLKLYEEVVDIKKFLYEERKSNDLETLEFFKNELEQLMFKINFIKKLMTLDVKKIELEKSINKLVFLKTNYGNVCALSDLKDIPSEYYEDFYELLESICDGSFKNFKTFTNNDSLKGLSEVRGEQTRIIFDRVSNNVYVIIYMFVKKTDKSASYHASLQNRNDLYKLNVEEIRNLVATSEDYLEENRTIKDKLYRILTKDNKVKKLGDINE